MPSGGCCGCCRAKLSIVTRVTVVNGIEVTDQTASRNVDPYVILNCEGVKSQSDWVGKDATPVWDHQSIFWRRNVRKPISLTVYDANYLRDSFLGKAVIEAPITNGEKTLELTLEDKTGKKLSGRITVKVATYDDPLYL